MASNNVKGKAQQRVPLIRQIPDASTQSVEELFQRADILMFKEKAYDRAEQIYRLILEKEPQSVDALNSLASCLRSKVS